MRHPKTAHVAFVLSAVALFVAGPLPAQEGVDPAVDSAADLAVDPGVAADEALFDDDELDALVAPVALYPDSLLTQVMVAATYPLDVVKADRLIGDGADQTAEARADAVAGEDWDPSIQVLASGFPTVINRMAEDIDWTEDLGDAVLAQTDDVLEAVQRMRAQAAASGTLASNDAQVVEVVDDAISIAPADPGVVYVPSYDPAMAFTGAPAAAPVVVADPGLSTTDLVTTGAIAFGSAFLINELFDDDDDWGDDYWHGPSHIDWDDGDFDPRPDVNIDGDVNVNRGRFTNVDRDRVNIDRDRAQDRIGGLDEDALRKAHDKGWKPSDQRQQAARDKIAARKTEGGATRPGGVAGAGIDRDRAGDARDKLRAGSAGSGGGDARAKLQKASAERGPGQAARRPDSALKPKATSAPEVRKAKARAAASGKAPEVRKAAASRPKPAAKPKAVSRPQAAKRPAAKHASSKSSAFKKSGGRPKAASSRGKASKSKRR